jgi:hypothetical protein
MIRLKNAGAKLSAAVIALGLAASGAAFASSYTVNVTLPQAAQVGNTTLQSGNYQLVEIPVNSVQSMFVFRDSTGHTDAVAQATRTVSPEDVNSFGASQKTELILSPNETGAMHLNQMFVEGDTTGYRFASVK